MSYPRRSVNPMPSASPAELARRASRDHLFSVLRPGVGDEFARGVKTYLPRIPGTTVDEVVETLAEGVTVSIRCYETGSNSAPTHKIRFAPDGTVTLLNHPEPSIEGEKMLMALGHTPVTCVAVAMFLPDRLPIPRSIPMHQAINNRLRAVHAAIQWAAEAGPSRSVWEPGFSTNYLRWGITPHEMRRWRAAGWDDHKALPWQQSMVELDLANKWRDANRTTQRDIKLARRGEVPHDEHEWTSAGFPSVAASSKWRHSGMSPREAFSWYETGANPTLVSHLRDSRLTRRAQPLATDRNLLTTWLSAGVGPSLVVNWFTETDGDLAESAKWAPVLGANLSAYHAVRSWRTEPDPLNVTPEQVEGFFSDTHIQVPRDKHLVKYMIDRDVSPESYKDLVERVIDGGVRIRGAQILQPTRGDSWSLRRGTWTSLCESLIRALGERLPIT